MTFKRIPEQQSVATINALRSHVKCLIARIKKATDERVQERYWAKLDVISSRLSVRYTRHWISFKRDMSC